MTKVFTAGLLLLVIAFGQSGCMSLKTEHKVEPIHITVDVNLRMERELDNFFDDIDEADPTLTENQDKTEEK